MSRRAIVANIQAHPDQIAWVQAALEKLILTTRAEPGCLQYDLHQDDDNPAHFMFFKKWESREAWQTHMKAPHLAADMAATDGAAAEFTLNEMTHIS